MIRDPHVTLRTEGPAGELAGFLESSLQLLEAVELYFQAPPRRRLRLARPVLDAQAVARWHLQRFLAGGEPRPPTTQPAAQEPRCDAS